MHILSFFLSLLVDIRPWSTTQNHAVGVGAYKMKAEEVMQTFKNDFVGTFDYFLEEKIGHGNFGEVYVARNIETDNDNFVAKVEPDTLHSLYHEYAVYSSLRGLPGFPKMHWFGQYDGKNILVLDRLASTIKGLTIRDHSRHINVPFSIRFVLWVGLQVVRQLEYLHTNASVVHRDLKPANIATELVHSLHPPQHSASNIHADYYKFGNNCSDHVPLWISEKDAVDIIDFGEGRFYMETEANTGLRTHVHYNVSDRVMESRFKSLNAHDGILLTRRDDIISTGYIMIYMLKGALPWEYATNASQQVEFKRITTNRELCRKLPEEFELFFDHAVSLGFYERPNYSYLRDLLLKIATRFGFVELTGHSWDPF